MKKSSWKFLVGITLISIFWLVISVTQAQSPVFRIGVLDDERGSISNGARLAVQEINNAGGVRGADGTFFRLELIIQPTNGGANLANAVTALSQASVIAVLGPESNTEVANGLATLRNLNVPILTPATGDTLLTSDTSGKLFRIRSAEVYQGRALAAYLVNDLQIKRIATVQLELDIDTTASNIGFSTAASALGVLPQPSFQIQNDLDIPQIVNQIIQANPEIAVAYGSPNRASQLYNGLRNNGWTGLFAYNQAEADGFRNAVPFNQLRDIISTTSWPFTASDEVSKNFRDNFIGAYGQIPNAVAASGYDAITMLAAAINRPGELQTNLAQLDNIRGVQGVLHPAQLARGETGNNAAVVQLGEFGAPQVKARFEDSQRVSLDQPIAPSATLAPAPTATLDGVFITIKQTRQNVRSGPSTNYDIIGQLNKDEQAKVIGATIDLAWVVIDFRGQQGWLATYLLDVAGNLNTVPIIAPPPTPTPQPSPTAPPFADIVIDAAIAAPSPIIVNQPFIVSVTVRNAGSVAAGSFAVAATFPPNNLFSSAVVPALGPGQSTVANLTGTFSNTGGYSVVIVADLNNQINEGPGGETNNLFNFNYFINKPILRQGSQTLNAGDTLDLEGNNVQGDANWNGAATELDGIFGAKVAVIPNVTLDTIHWDLLNPSVVNQANVLRTQMNGGTIIGIITADGNRGVIRVDDIPGSQLKVTFIVYQN